jgi:hypothetical protein
MSQTRALPINAGQRYICWIFGRSYGDHPALTPPSPSRAVTRGPQRCGHRRAPTACPHPAVPPRRPFGSQTYCPARSPTTSEWTSTNEVQNVKQPWPGVPARAVSRSARCSADAVEGSEGLSNSRTAVITKRKTRWSRICRAQLRLLWNYGTPFIAGPQKRPPGRNWPLTPMAVPLLQAPPIAADTNSRRSAHEDRSPLRGCGLISGSAADQLCWPKLFAARSRGYMVTPWGC